MNPKTLWIGLLVVAILIGGLFVFRSKDADTPENATTTGAVAEEQPRGVLVDGTYTIDTEESVINWTGRKPKILGYEDTGTLTLEGGTVTVVNGNVVSGEFIIDMDSLAVTKTSSTKNPGSMLETHLRSDDFLSVETYPTAKFVLESVVDGTVTGDLTIKNKTSPISFPSAIRSESDTRLVAQAALVMDRTVWDIRYGSDNFFDNLGNNIIADEVQLSFNLVATK